MSKPKIRIEVVSDVVCPWCYIGKRRMEKAIDQLQNRYDFALSYSPFELNPDAPQEGVDQKAYLTRKFGGEERYHQLTNHVTEIAAGEGLTFNYAIQEVSPNTRDAHRIIWLARQEGQQIAVKEAFMKAYFELGIDLSKKENLVTVAAGAGLSGEKVRAFLDSDEGSAEVIRTEEINFQRGITGVPFYIINDKYGVSGAQPTDILVNMLSEVGDAK